MRNNQTSSSKELIAVEDASQDVLKIYRKRYTIATIFGLRFVSFIKIAPNTAELKGIEDGLLRSCRVQTKEAFNLSQAFNIQLNRVRDRWNVAIKRTTGFVFLDTIQSFFAGFAIFFTGIYRILFGTRIRFSDLLEGAEFRCKSLEELKETETMVFASIAAIIRAARYAAENDIETTYVGDEFLQNIRGLTFAGGMAGTLNIQDEDDPEENDDEEGFDDFEDMEDEFDADMLEI